jgi:hypothetical protein
VDGKLTTVRVEEIVNWEETDKQNASGRPRKAANRYEVTELATGRKLTFRSAVKFLGEVKPIWSAYIFPRLFK